MTIRLTAPSKTFLCGEYGVLLGGPALVINTQPRFELLARLNQNQNAQHRFHKNSPAGILIAENLKVFSGLSIEFNDPHQGRGGLGASSAQFLLVSALKSFLQDKAASYEEIWSDYQRVTAKSGSGVDVVSQYTGKIARIQFSPLLAEAEDWPYSEIGFVVLRTGNKVLTHKHLSSLERSRLETLKKISNSAFEAFDAESSEVFLAKVHQFSKSLKELGLEDFQTSSLIEDLAQQDWYLAAKGCGAMGADTILAFYPSEERKTVLDYAASMKLEVCATESDLSLGLEVTHETR